MGHCRTPGPKINNVAVPAPSRGRLLKPFVAQIAISPGNLEISAAIVVPLLRLWLEHKLIYVRFHVSVYIRNILLTCHQ